VNTTALVEVDNLAMYFPITSGFFNKVTSHTRAVDGVSFAIRQGETLGLVGESGSGRLSSCRCLARAYAPTGGELRYLRSGGEVVNLAGLPESQLRPYRKEIRMIFQDPYSSLNPRMTVFDTVAEVLRVNGLAQGSELEDRVGRILHQVGLRREYMRRYPHAFSGGERQRIVIARALVTEPRLVIADEAVSALDVSIRAQVLNLLEELRATFNLTYLFISHDLSVVRHSCDRVVVMYVGKVVEVAETSKLFTQPSHPYTQALLAAVPVHNPLHRAAGRRTQLTGEVPDPSNPPSGCRFHPRCPFARERCRVEAPALRELPDERAVACHFAEEIAAQVA
jgi:peptide/nickel transport system ATP-binding protein